MYICYGCFFTKCWMYRLNFNYNLREVLVQSNFLTLPSLKIATLAYGY
jgi:hypothetical protein